MSGKANKGSGGGSRLLDFFIVVIFLSIAVFCLNLFRLDLMQTISLKNVEPVGTVVVKKNTVQRRLSDRVLWDRLAYESPVYLGDLIRVADVSAATLHIEDNSIDLEENTIIRITRSADGEGFQIVLNEGALSLVTGEGGGISLDLNGKQVQTGSGTVLSAAAKEDGGVAVQVNEGSARIVEERGPAREISSGMAVTMDSGGAERLERAAVVRTPAPNARYVKNTAAPLAVGFSWNRINIDSRETLRLEVSADRNFSQITNAVGGLDRQAQVFFDAGSWFWRLSLEDTVLSTGRLTVVNGAAVRLESPASNSVFRYQDELPVINFQWAEVEEAASYILEVSNAPDFIYTRIRRQGPAAFHADSSLGEGTWYWRVMPVFPSVYEGAAAFSPAASFGIERAASAAADVPLAQWLASEAPPELVPPPAAVEPPRLGLVSPADGAVIAGLAALRTGAAFQWETGGDVEIAGSRFVVSSNPNPLGGQPAIEIRNPGRSVRVESLGEGTWYWTVELQTSGGVTVSASRPRRLVVQPIPLLPSPQNMSPAGVSFGVSDLQSRRNIVFNWAAVQGANAYIFTLYQQTASGRRQIVRTAAENRTSYTLDNLRLLDRGTFVWQVEAVNIRNGAIEQRGRAGESTFALNFPSPGPVQIEDTGVLYGN